MRDRMPNRFWVSLFILSALLITGCAGAKLKDARSAFHRGDVREASQIIREADGSGLSKLEYLMEKGMMLHHSGEYEKSIRELRQAADLIREQDIVSLSQQAGSIVINEWVTEYKGEYAERLWVHTYLMMNYLLLMKHEDALVEAKLTQRVLDEYPEALARDYFSRALIALCYEMLQEYNDAYIVYKKLAEVIPDKSLVTPHIRRLAKKLGFQDDPELSGGGKQDSGPVLPSGGNSAELILFVSMGSGPQKTAGNLLLPPGVRISFPRYKKQSSYTGRPEVVGSNVRKTSAIIETDMLSVAKDSLDERAKLIYTKEAARIAAKEVIIRGFERNNKDSPVGLLLRLAFIAMEEADTRGWETLPAKLSMVRVFLEPGTHKLRVNIRGGSDNTIDLPEIRFLPGEKVFYSLRSSGGSTSVYGMRKEAPEEESMAENPSEQKQFQKME